MKENILKIVICCGVGGVLSAILIYNGLSMYIKKMTWVKSVGVISDIKNGPEGTYYGIEYIDNLNYKHLFYPKIGSFRVYEIGDNVDVYYNLDGGAAIYDGLSMCLYIFSGLVILSIFCFIIFQTSCCSGQAHDIPSKPI